MTIKEIGLKAAARIISPVEAIQDQAGKILRDIELLKDKGYANNDDYNMIIEKYGSAENAPVKGES